MTTVQCSRHALFLLRFLLFFVSGNTGVSILPYVTSHNLHDFLAERYQNKTQNISIMEAVTQELTILGLSNFWLYLQKYFNSGIKFICGLLGYNPARKYHYLILPHGPHLDPKSHGWLHIIKQLLTTELSDMTLLSTTESPLLTLATASVNIGILWWVSHHIQYLKGLNISC